MASCPPGCRGSGGRKNARKLLGTPPGMTVKDHIATGVLEAKWEQGGAQVQAMEDKRALARLAKKAGQPRPTELLKEVGRLDRGAPSRQAAAAQVAPLLQGASKAPAKPDKVAPTASPAPGKGKKGKSAGRPAASPAPAPSAPSVPSVRVRPKGAPSPATPTPPGPARPNGSTPF